MTAVNIKNICFAVLENELEGRIDPHFYKPEFLTLIHNIEKSKFEVKTLNEIAKKITSGATPKSGGNDYTSSDEGIPFIRSGDISEDEKIDFDDVLYIKKNVHNKRLKSSQLQKGDVLIAIVGATIGQVSVYNDDKEANINQAIALVRCNDNVNPQYIKAFLLSKIGQKQLNRIKRPVARANINLEEVGSFKVALPPLKIQNQIVEIMQKAYKDKEAKEKQAQELLNSIDDYVLGELGIKLPELKDKMCFSVDSEDIKNQRIAPDYYQPRFTKTEKAIKNAKYKIAKLKDVLEYVKKGIEVGSKAYTDEGAPFVRVADIDDLKINIQNTAKKISFDLYQELKNAYKPMAGELLYSKDGSIGFCAIVEGYDDFITSGGILRLKINDKFNSYYIKTLLSSKLFKIIAGQKSIGAIIKHLLPEELLNFQIPLPPLAIQNKIASEVKKRMKKSEDLKSEGQRLVEEAKSEVEKIILGK
jgi:restriction endonuclease S subunit